MSGNGGIPIVGLLKNGQSGAGGGGVTNLCKHLLRIIVFLALGIVIYSPFGTQWINNPSPGWNINRSATSWGTDYWDWDVIDCIYFAMVTMTTVGYGDMPTLRQEMRLLTIPFGLFGVIFIAASISAIADSFTEISRKNFITKQRELLVEAKAATALVLEGKQRRGHDAVVELPPQSAPPSPPPLAVRAPPPSPPPSPPRVVPFEDDPSAAPVVAAAVQQPPQQPQQEGESPKWTKSHEESPDGVVGLAEVAPHGADALAESSVRTPRPMRQLSTRIVSAAAAEVVEQPLTGWRRFIPSRESSCRVLGAFRPTGLFFLLSFVLAEIENNSLSECGGFGAGWSTCFTPYQCELWKNGELPADIGLDIDRSYCWSWIDMFHFAFATYITIGYGDVAPHSKGGKLLAAFLVAFGVFCFTTLLGSMMEFRNSQRLGGDKTLKQRLQELREVIAQDDDGTVTPEEYILFNLKKMNKVDDETLLLLRDQFHALDADGSGALDASDIDMLTQACSVMEGNKPLAEKASGNRRGSLNSVVGIVRTPTKEKPSESIGPPKLAQTTSPSP